MSIKGISNRRLSRRRRPFSRRQRRGIGLAGIIVLLGLFWAGRAGWLPEAEQSDRVRYHNKIFRAVKVVDGDTLDLDVTDGRERYTRVRLWGVDTPETKHPEMPVMYYGPEAAEFTRQMVLDKEVLVMLEPFENTRDIYDRLLAYIYLPQDEKGLPVAGETPAVYAEEAGGTPAVQMLNEELIRLGYGYADNRFRHMFRERFDKLQQEAQSAGRGLWAEVKPEQWPEWYRNRQKSLE